MDCHEEFAFNKPNEAVSGKQSLADLSPPTKQQSCHRDYLILH